MKDFMKSKKFKLIVVIIALLIIITYTYIHMSLSDHDYVQVGKYSIQVEDDDYFSSGIDNPEGLDDYELISSNEEETLYCQIKEYDNEESRMNSTENVEDGRKVVRTSEYLTFNKQQCLTRYLLVSEMDNRYLILFSYPEYNEQNQVIKDNYSWMSLTTTGYCINASHETVKYYDLFNKKIAITKHDSIINDTSIHDVFDIKVDSIIYDTDIFPYLDIAMNNTIN